MHLDWIYKKINCLVYSLLGKHKGVGGGISVLSPFPPPLWQIPVYALGPSSRFNVLIEFRLIPRIFPFQAVLHFTSIQIQIVNNLITSFEFQFSRGVFKGPGGGLLGAKPPPWFSKIYGFQFFGALH